MLFLKLCLNCGHYVFMQMSCLFWSLIEDPFNFSVHEMFHQKTCLEISVKHAWKSVFIISGVTFFFFFFFQFRQCGFRDAYQSCVHALIPALARTWFVTTFRHYWSICLSVLSVPCGCQNFSRLAKSWSPFLQTRVNLWIWCCTVLQVFFHLRGHLTISLSVIEISYRNGPEIMHRRMHSSHFKCLSMQCPQLLWPLRCAP